MPRVPEKAGRTVRAVRLAEMADKVGRRVVANVISVAVVARLSGLLSQDSVKAAVHERVARGKELNQKAIAAGYALAINATT